MEEQKNTIADEDREILTRKMETLSEAVENHLLNVAEYCKGKSLESVYSRYVADLFAVLLSNSVPRVALARFLGELLEGYNFRADKIEQAIMRNQQTQIESPASYIG